MSASESTNGGCTEPWDSLVLRLTVPLRLSPDAIGPKASSATKFNPILVERRDRVVLRPYQLLRQETGNCLLEEKCEQATTAAVLEILTHKLSRVCHSQSPSRKRMHLDKPQPCCCGVAQTHVQKCTSCRPRAVHSVRLRLQHLRKSCDGVSGVAAAALRAASSNRAARGTWPAIQDGHRRCGHMGRLGYIPLLDVWPGRIQALKFDTERWFAGRALAPATDLQAPSDDGSRCRDAS